MGRLRGVFLCPEFTPGRSKVNPPTPLPVERYATPQRTKEAPQLDIHNPYGLPLSNASGYITGQPDRDEEHVSEIAADMAAHGWRGAPLVVLGDYLRAYTGTHRLAAAEIAGVEYVPAIELEDLCHYCGQDLWQICAEEDLSALMDRPEVLSHLPREALREYGLDDIE